MGKAQHATLSNIGGGLAERLFHLGMDRVLENIADENTSAGKARTVQITWTIKPDETRTQTTIDVSMKTGLAQVGSKKAVTYLSKDENGDPRMTVNDPKQMELADQLAAVGENK